MARKFGKPVEIKLNPLDYNLGIIGESGIGKSTLAMEVCEKLVGKDGYIALNVGKEDGHDAIAGIVSANIPDWSTFIDFIDDVIDNKEKDYKDLKVVIVDTFDQMMEIAEREVIRLHNKLNPDKKTDSIRASWGGFMAGEDKALEITLDKLWELKGVGVQFFIIGHTKKRDIEDVVTGQTYSTLTTNMSQRYFNGLKTKLHVLGVASIDREIVQQKTGKKNIVTKQDEVKGKVLSESRRVTFRDDNYTIDSKSRFANIVDEIPLDADAFIEAIENAIRSEHDKSGKDFEKTKKEQEKSLVKKEKEALEKVRAEKKTDKLEDKRQDFVGVITSKFSKATDEIKTQAKELLAETGCKKFTDNDVPIEILQQIAELFK